MGHMQYMVKIMLWDQQRISFLEPEHPDLVSKDVELESVLVG